MVKKSRDSGRALADSRGLPPDLDPRRFYEYSLDHRLESSSGLEYFLHRLIPRDWMRSFAVAIDPFSSLKVSNVRVTPVTRKRSRSRVSVLDTKIQLTKLYDRTLQSSVPNWNNIPGSWGPPVTQTWHTDSSGTTTGQASVPDEMSDTTARTRLLGSEFGEARSFESALFIPSRSLTRTIHSVSRAEKNPSDPGLDQVRDDFEVWYRAVSVAATVPKSRIDQVRIEQYNLADSLIQKNAVKLYNRAMPDSRQYSLFRNLVELKDVPRSIASLRETLRTLGSAVSNLRDPVLARSILDLSNTSSRIPSEYLAFHFGWKQLYSDVQDLLALPERIYKRFNYLNRKSRSNQVLRSRSRLVLPSPTTPLSLDWIALDYEELRKTDYSAIRTADLSVTIGHGYDFPDLMPVSFSEQKFWNVIGAVPTPQDLWNLVPWSWLVDWFIGVDDYIEAIQRINSDRNLINYGLISCDLITEVTASLSSRVRSETTTSYRPFGGTEQKSTVYSYQALNCNALVKFRTRVRKDLSQSLAHIETTADPTKLTSYRRSILGALISQSIWNSSRK